MPRKKRTVLDEVIEARIQMIQVCAGKVFDHEGQRFPSPPAEELRAFRELCDAAIEAARREVDEAGIEALSERLQALIDAHNKLSDIVESQERRLAARGEGRAGRRLG